MRRARWASCARCSTRTRATLSSPRRRRQYAELRRQFADRDDRTRRLTLDEARANRLRSTSRARRRGRPSSGPRAMPDLDLASSIDVHRLDALLRRLGGPRPLPRSARRPTAGQRRAIRCSTMPSGCSQRVVDEAPAARGGGRRLLARQRRPPTTTSCCTPTSRQRPSSPGCTPCASRWPSRTVGRTSRWPTTSRRSESGAEDYVGAFAVTAGGGLDEAKAAFETRGRRLLGDPAELACRSAGRGGGGVAARQGAPRAVGLRARREASTTPG